MRAIFLLTIVKTVKELVLLNNDESGIVGSSVLRNMIMQDLVNRGLERPAFG